MSKVNSKQEAPLYTPPSANVDETIEVTDYNSKLVVGEDGTLKKWYYPVIKAKDEDQRMIEFVISDETNDRHGEVIPITAWKLDNYEKVNIVKFMHLTGSSPVRTNPLEGVHLTIGKAELYIEGTKLCARIFFEPKEINPLADTVYKKLLWGSLKAVSVGFIWLKGHYGVQAEGEDSGTYYYDLVELTEISVVDIPANPNAVMKSLNQSRKDWIKKQHHITTPKADSDHTESDDTPPATSGKGGHTRVATSVAQAHINISKSLTTTNHEEK